MPTNTPVSVSAIICAYSDERWDDLLKAINSIKNQTLPIQEIIVVIDHNRHLYERLQKEVDNIQLLENLNARGASEARNTGIAVAQGDILAFLDDDAVAAPDCFEVLVEHFKDEKVLGVGGFVEPNWEKNKPGWFPEEFYWVIGCSYRGIQDNPKYIRNLIGACMCLRREIFTTVGNFNSGLGPGSQGFFCEETELCIRAKEYWPEKEYRYEPKARAYHHVPDKRTTFSYFKQRCYVEGISKTVVVQFAGSSQGLSSERTYVLKTLPTGVFGGIRDAFRGDFAGIGRALAIIAGLSITLLGYIIGTIKKPRDSSLGKANLKAKPTHD